MATKKSKVFKKASKNKRKIPRWGIVLVIGLVAAIGIFVIYSSLAATGIIAKVNTKKIIGAGDGGMKDINDNNVQQMAPVTLEACRMSDTPGDGPENRIYIGVKPVVTKELANKLNAVWDSVFPQYHIDGQDVPWAYDYTQPKSVGIFAMYIVDGQNPTETKWPYTSLYKPSEVYKKLAKPGGWWNGDGMFNPGSAQKTATMQRLGAAVVNMIPSVRNRDFPPDLYPLDPDPNITASWKKAVFLASPVGDLPDFGDKAYDINDLLAYNKQVTKNVGRQSQAQDNIDSAKQIPVAGVNTPFTLIPPGALPGRTTWTYLDSKVMVKKEGCDNIGSESCYDIINNPNPMVYFDLGWKSNQAVAKVGNSPSSVNNEQNIRKGVRFKDLPKCGQAPYPNTQAQIDEYKKFKQKMDEINAKVGGTGVSTKSGPQAWRVSDLRVNNGLSPISTTPRSLGYEVLGEQNQW